MNDTSPLILPPPPPSAAPGPATTKTRGRGAFAAVVLTGALVVGGGAGVAGAAAWQEWSPSGADRSTSGPTATSAADREDTPAPDGSVQQVAGVVLPSVVKIDVSGREGGGSGSGIILSADGEILTNHHVVEAAEQGGELSVAFADGTRAAAEIVGSDPLTDTAVIQTQDVSGLTPATIGQSGKLDVGQQVVAIGSPFGLDATVTSGIVSALDRPVSVGTDAEGNSTTYPAVQTDAAINPGNSGGPLVDMNGDVVGINSSIRTAQQGGSIGLGFAIPIDEVLPVIDQIRNGETPTHARLGISVSDLRGEAGGLPGDGAQVQAVTEGSIADSSGLQAGDVITRVEDTHISSADSLVATVRSYRPGDEVTVTYLRDGETLTLTLELESDG